MSLQEKIKDLETWVDANIHRTAWVRKDKVLGELGVVADKIRVKLISMEVSLRKDREFGCAELFQNVRREIWGLLVEKEENHT